MKPFPYLFCLLRGVTSELPLGRIAEAPLTAALCRSSKCPLSSDLHLGTSPGSQPPALALACLFMTLFTWPCLHAALCQVSLCLCEALLSTVELVLDPQRPQDPAEPDRSGQEGVQRDLPSDAHLKPKKSGRAPQGRHPELL